MVEGRGQARGLAREVVGLLEDQSQVLAVGLQEAQGVQLVQPLGKLLQLVKPGTKLQ